MRDRGGRLPQVLGIVSGAVMGLVMITPAAGYVDQTGAFFMGRAPPKPPFSSPHPAQDGPCSPPFSPQPRAQRPLLDAQSREDTFHVNGQILTHPTPFARAGLTGGVIGYFAIKLKHALGFDDALDVPPRPPASSAPLPPVLTGHVSSLLPY